MAQKTAYAILLGLTIILQTTVVVSCLRVHNVTCNLWTTNCRCKENADVCVFNLQITKLQTFTRYQIHDNINEPGVTGRIYYFEDNGDLKPLPLAVTTTTHCENLKENDTSCTPAFTADGITYRSFVAVNGQMPGPTLIVYVNQILEVNVINGMQSDATTIHWHGLRMKNTPWMDGMEYLSQNVIKPKSSFRYIFEAYPSGTFWYHSHTSSQRSDGCYGGLIILERNMKDIQAKLGTFQDIPEQHVIHIAEWYPQSSSNYMREALSNVGSIFVYDHPPEPNDMFAFPLSPDGAKNGYLFFWSALINGRGKHPDTSKYPYIKSRLSIFTVNPGEIYRFRLIGVGNFLFQLSVDEHQLRVIATDGYLVQPVSTDYIMINSGERYDFLLQAKNSSDLQRTGKTNFWIRGEILSVEHGTYPLGPLPGVAPFHLLSERSAEAILHYNVSGTQLPKSSEYEAIKNASIPHSRKCSQEQPCHAVNCPFVFHPTYNMSCTHAHQLKLLFPAPEEELPLNEPEPGQGRELFFNFATEGIAYLESVNGRSLNLPTTPLQIITDPNERQKLAEHEFCDNDPNLCKHAVNKTALPECKCVYVEDLPVFGSTTRMVLSTVVQDSYIHPVHFHGHNFFVMDIVFPEYNSTTGFRGCYKDLDCSVPEGMDPCAYAHKPNRLSSNYTCNYPKWKKGHRPFYGNPHSKINPYTVRKDTVAVPAGGYVVIQFVTDNPGYWFMHCHIEGHTLVSMAVIINEVLDRQPPPPAGMQKCGNFSWSLEDFYNITSTASKASFSTHTNSVHGGNHYHQNIDGRVSSPKMMHAIPNQPQPKYPGKVENVMTGDDTTHLMVCKVVQLGSSDN